MTFNDLRLLVGGPLTTKNQILDLPLRGTVGLSTVLNSVVRPRPLRPRGSGNPISFSIYLTSLICAVNCWNQKGK